MIGHQDHHGTVPWRSTNAPEGPSAAICAIATIARRARPPEVGRVTLDCDVLSVAGSDLRLVVYTAAAGSPDAEALALLGAIGLQTF